ncbi:MAG: hypothetical protein ABW022_10090 [Actinoplanes sp.]
MSEREVLQDDPHRQIVRVGDTVRWPPLTSTDGLVDEVIAQQQQVIDRAQRLADDSHEPQRTWQADGSLAETAKRVDWSRQHRHLCEQLTAGR